jgi:hypothetical protein
VTGQCVSRAPLLRWLAGAGQTLPAAALMTFASCAMILQLFLWKSLVYQNFINKSFIRDGQRYLMRVS